VTTHHASDVVVPAESLKLCTRAALLLFRLHCSALHGQHDERPYGDCSPCNALHDFFSRYGIHCARCLVLSLCCVLLIHMNRSPHIEVGQHTSKRGTWHGPEPSVPERALLHTSHSAL